MATDNEFRDPALDALLREHSQETPPPQVDAAILASARNAVRMDARAQARARIVRFLSIAMPIAAAATVAIVVINPQPVAPTLQERVQHEVTEPRAASVEPAQASARADAAKSRGNAVDAASSAAEERSSLDWDAARGKTTPMPQAMPTPLQDAAPASAATSKIEGTTSASKDQPQFDQRTAVQPSSSAFAQSPASLAGAAPAGARATAKRRDESTTVDATKDAPTVDAAKDAPTVDAWIARIRALRDAGKQREALDEIARFRARFSDADARLPADLRTLR